MKNKIKDHLILVWASLSIILLGSIFLSLVAPKQQPAEVVHETVLYTAEPVNETIDLDSWHSVVNRIDQIEIDIKLLKLALELEEVDPPIVEIIKKNEDNSSTLSWPPRFNLKFKSPSQ